MVAIQKEIIRDENGDPKSVIIPYEQFCALMEEVGQPEEPRMWSPEELGNAADKFADEKDPVKADKMWEEIVAGFYGK